MRFFRRFFLLLLLAFTGCATAQVVLPTKTFDGKYASANATLTAINKATTAAYNQKAISAETGRAILLRSKAAGKTIDYAYSLKTVNLGSALNQLTEANKELGALKILLATFGVTI